MNTIAALAIAGVLAVGSSLSKDAPIVMRLRFCTGPGEEAQYSDLKACFADTAAKATMLRDAIPDIGRWAGASCTNVDALTSQAPEAEPSEAPPDSAAERHI